MCLLVPGFTTIDEHSDVTSGVTAVGKLRDVGEGEPTKNSGTPVFFVLDLGSL